VGGTGVGGTGASVGIATTAWLDAPLGLDARLLKSGAGTTVGTGGIVGNASESICNRGWFVWMAACAADC
jgi:hypothetical protein